MDKEEAQAILEAHYKNAYISDAKESCDSKEIIGDILKLDFNAKAAAIELGVFIQEVSLVGGPHKGLGMMVKHNPALSPR